MILTTQEFLVVIQRKRQVNLVATRTELGRFMKRLEKRPFVELWFCFHELIVDPLKCRVVTVGERIMQRLFDRVVRVTPGAVHVGNRVTDRAGDAGLRRRMVDRIKLRIVKRAAEERHRIVTACAPARRLDIAITLQRDFARSSDAGVIRWIIEGTEAMNAIAPGGVNIRVALLTVVIVHQAFRWNELAGRGPC